MRPRIRATAAASALLVLGSVAVTLLALEAALRLRSEGFLRPPPSGGRLNLTESRYPARYDETLGYMPRPGAGGRDNVWRAEVNIDAQGFRSNGRAARPPGPPIVALGDSFTFGDEVDDDQTWPAHLERILGRPVWNAGVFGYGFDQMVLRAERIAESAQPALLVASVIGETVERCGYAYRFAAKPWFEIAADGLALRNVPVRPPRAGGSPLAWLVKTSHLASLLARRLDPVRWALPDTVRAHGQDLPVARRLLDRLQALADERGFGLLLVGQMVPGRDDTSARRLLAHAERAGVAVLAVEPESFVADPSDPEQLGRFFTSWRTASRWRPGT